MIQSHPEPVVLLLETPLDELLLNLPGNHVRIPFGRLRALPEELERKREPGHAHAREDLGLDVVREACAQNPRQDELVHEDPRARTVLLDESVQEREAQGDGLRVAQKLNYAQNSPTNIAVHAHRHEKRRICGFLDESIQDGKFQIDLALSLILPVNINLFFNKLLT